MEAGASLDTARSIPPTRRRVAGRLAGDLGRLWIVAHQQTAGRGRRGRAWISPQGNSPRHRSHDRSLSAGARGPARLRRGRGAGARPQWISAQPKLAQMAERSDVAWRESRWNPRESVGLAGRRAAFVVGIGVNCAHAPRDLDRVTSRLTRADGQTVGAGELFERLAQRFHEALATSARRSGFRANSRRVA